MAFSAKILADSVAPNGARLTTFELTFPRVILAEFNTHRMISRNAASSRAIPTERLIQRVMDDPFIPDFRLNRRGMQAGESLEIEQAEGARNDWLQCRDEAVRNAERFHSLNIHKQYVNRLLEPWMWCTVIASATEWANLFALRCTPEAEPSFRRIATMALEAYRESEPRCVGMGEWHVPLFFEDDVIELSEHNDNPEGVPLSEMARAISVGRCARVSYLTHDGKRDHQADIDLHDRLMQSGHWSPFEHVATPQHDRWMLSGNFFGWTQYRKEFRSENRGWEDVPV